MTKEITVGLFILASALSTAYVAMKMTKGGLQSDKTIEYYTVLPNATGLVSDVPIRMAGISIGRLGEISLTEDKKARLNLLVSENVELRVGAKVKIKSAGMLGDKFVEIQPGDLNAPQLQPGSLIPASSGGGGAEDFLSSASDVLVEVRDIVAEIKKSTMSPDESGKSKFAKIIDNLEGFTGDLNEISNSNKDKITSAVDSLASSLKSLKDELDKTKNDSTLKNMNAMMKNLREASKDFKEIVADLKAGKGTIGKLMRDEETVDQINTTLSGVNKFLGTADRLRTDVDIHAELDTKNDNTRTYLNILMSPSPGKGYLLGVAMTPRGIQTNTITETKNGESLTREEKSVTEEDKLKFNAQYMHRFADFRFRLGIMESTGGLGTDFAPLGYPFKLSFDAFDFDEDIGPNFKLSGNYRFFKVFYLNTGVDRLFSPDLRSFFVGAGLRFTDDDLKLLLTKVPMP